MEYRCPGRNFRQLKVELYLCPKCHGEVEIFSDESRVRCQRCGEIIKRAHQPSCVEWCASAKQCLGIRSQKTDIKE